MPHTYLVCPAIPARLPHVTSLTLPRVHTSPNLLTSCKPHSFLLSTLPFFQNLLSTCLLPCLSSLSVSGAGDTEG